MSDSQGPDDQWLFAGSADVGEVAQRYDAWAESYDADLDAWSYRAPGRVARTVVERRPGATSALDVGCGTGMVGRALRAHGYAGELHGLDASEASLARAAQGKDYATLRSADLQQPLPVGDDAVDVAVCVGVMTYLPDTEAVWRELARVVRSGGLVVVTQREDLWEARGCGAVVDGLAADGVWTPLEVSEPQPYLPEAGGALGDLGARYLTAEVA